MTLLPLHAADYFPTLDARQAPSLVIFTAPACGSCRRLKALLSTLLPPLPALVAYEVRAEESPGLIEALEVRHLPALFLYRDGDYHAPIETVLEERALISAVLQAAAGPRQEPP